MVRLFEEGMFVTLSLFTSFTHVRKEFVQGQDVQALRRNIVTVSAERVRFALDLPEHRFRTRRSLLGFSDATPKKL